MERSRKGSSDARIAGDPRITLASYQKHAWTSYSGDYLKYIIRPKNGVGRPPAINLARFEKEFVDLYIAEGAF